jgi:type I restriction-modification system DNA methylase subunit
MTEMLRPQPGESIYDPTCGSGGMLLSCIAHLRRQGKEWRNVRLYGLRLRQGIAPHPKARKNRILLINAVEEVTRERAQSFLTDEHIERIVKAYERFADEPGFARVATREEVRAKDGNLSIPLYVSAQEKVAREPGAEYQVDALPAALEAWLESVVRTRAALRALLDREKR